MRPALFTTIAVTIITSLEGTVMLADESFSFDHDVMPILSRAGCNMGTCHGNLNGKGGLRLSLRGQDPSLDYLALTHELGGRRVNRNAPTQSLLLLKPVADVPHQGGQRFIRGSREYEIIRSWIANGTPPPSNTAPKVKHLEVSPTGLVVRSQKSTRTKADITGLNAILRSWPVGGSPAATFMARPTATVCIRWFNLSVPKTYLPPCFTFLESTPATKSTTVRIAR